MVKERSDESFDGFDESLAVRHLPAGGGDGRTKVEERLRKLETETRDGLGESHDGTTERDERGHSVLVDSGTQRRARGVR
jgi:hypothetical protein